MIPQFPGMCNEKRCFGLHATNVGGIQISPKRDFTTPKSGRHYTSEIFVEFVRSEKVQNEKSLNFSNVRTEICSEKCSGLSGPLNRDLRQYSRNNPLPAVAPYSGESSLDLRYPPPPHVLSKHQHNCAIPSPRGGGIARYPVIP